MLYNNKQMPRPTAAAAAALAAPLVAGTQAGTWPPPHSAGWEPIGLPLRYYIGRTVGLLGIAAVTSLSVLMLAGHKAVDEQLGGAKQCAALSAAIVAALWLVGQLVRGNQDSTLAALFPLVPRPRVRYGGSVKPGFEKVEAQFRLHFDQGVEAGAQCSAYIKGELVVDLWGVREGTPGANTYSGSTLQNVFSSTKVVTSLVVAMLVDRGQLAYATTLASLWPEFGAHGKEDLTVKELMRHEGGLPAFNAPMPMESLSATAVKAGR